MFTFSFYNCFLLLLFKALTLCFFLSSVYYQYYLWLISMLCSIVCVLLRYCLYVLSTSLLCPSRIFYLRCKYLVHFALVECWTCNWSLGLSLIALHVRMSIFLLNVHCSHSLMTVFVWSRYAYMLWCAYKLDRTLLAHVRTLCLTFHKLNESFVCVQVFQVTGICLQVLHNF